MCRMQLNFSCKRQLQNPKFLVMTTKSSIKSNSHTCTSAKASASHFVSSKCPSKVSKYSPNNRGLRGQPCLTPCWHLKLEVTPSLGWLMHTVSLAYIAYMHHKKLPSNLRPTKHLPQHFMLHNIERLFEVHKATIERLIFCLALFYQSSQYEKLVNSAVIFAKPSLSLGTQPMLFNPLIQPFVKYHNE
jgi:hypothetical protein